MDVLSMPALTMKELGTKRSTSTPFDAVLMCVDRHWGYTSAAPTTNEGLTGQRAADLLYHNWFTVFGPPRELITDNSCAFVSFCFKTFCHFEGVHKAESVAYLSRNNGEAENAGRQLFTKLAKLHRENKVHWYEGLPRTFQAYDELPGRTGVSLHVAVFVKDFTSTSKKKCFSNALRHTLVVLDMH